MATILYVGTLGSDDPTRATMPFLAAVGALDAGHQPQIALLGEATYLVKDHIAEQVAGVGLAPLRDLLPRLVSQGVPIHV